MVLFEYDARILLPFLIAVDKYSAVQKHRCQFELDNEYLFQKRVW